MNANAAKTTLSRYRLPTLNFTHGYTSMVSALSRRSAAVGEET